MHGSRFRFQVPVPVSLYRCIAVSLFSSSRNKHITELVKKASKRIYFLIQLKRAKIPIQELSGEARGRASRAEHE